MYNTIEEMTRAMKSNRQYDVSKVHAEKSFEDIATRFLNNETISASELEYFNTFLGKYYPDNVGGPLYPYPKYDEKLKPIYKDVADFYTKNLNRNTPESVTFLQYFYLTQMSKEYGITPNIIIDEDYFKNRPNSRAYHTEKYISGIRKSIPYVAYNPKFIKAAAEDTLSIPDLLATGFHELEHEIQQLNINNEELTNAQSIIWAKEHIVRTFIGDDYYKLNYKDMFIERDARKISTQRVANIYKRLGLNVNINDDNEYKLNIMHKKDNDSNDTLAVDLLDILASKVISEKPSLLEKYPVLKNIYDSRGNKKTLSEIQTELFDKCTIEIEKDPSREEELWNKYNDLISKICETDNDLQFQFLCQVAANYYSLNNMDSFNNTVSKINELINKRELSYYEYINKLQSRINELTNIKQNLLSSRDSYNRADYVKCIEEIKSTKYLLDAILEYNPKFKEKHNEIVMKRNIKIALTKKLKRNALDEYRGYISERGIEYEKKTKEDLYDDYRNNIKKLVDNATSQQELDNDIKNLGLIYSDYIDINNLEQYKTKEGASR